MVNTTAIVCEMNIIIVREGNKDLAAFRFKESPGIKCKSTPNTVELF